MLFYMNEALREKVVKTKNIIYNYEAKTGGDAAFLYIYEKYIKRKNKTGEKFLCQ